MMRASNYGDPKPSLLYADERYGGVCWPVSPLFRALIILVLALVAIPRPAAAQGATMQLIPVAGGLTGTQVGNNYFTSFGTMNSLGIGAPGAGITVAPLSNGALYFSEYQIIIAGLRGTHKAGITAFVSTNFVHPAAEILQNCPSTATCTASGSYSAMSTNALTPTNVVAAPGVGNTTVTVGVGIFLPDNDGASAYTGNDTVAFTLTLTDLTNGRVQMTSTVFLNTPAETVQDAVRMTLSTATGGLTVTPAADYSMNFGNVNGLGIGPAAGLTTVSVAGGKVYSTPYLLNPVFTDFTSTTATIKVALTTNFAHPVILQLDDSGNSGGPFAQITPAALQITKTAGDRSSITRYLGLFVSNTNGAGAFTGSDTATLTFTMTVP